MKSSLLLILSPASHGKAQEGKEDKEGLDEEEVGDEEEDKEEEIVVLFFCETRSHMLGAFSLCAKCACRASIRAAMSW
ncbi:hypothetical protein A3F36_02045 [Candidatus Peribacteria bacterium RIFCSPHIGHO2_12_FULL_55_11]|nr:MAG: hypothetical protein A3F36_02045 [Candidatus Peribacteria bacterium RIFCSPHIGHO2_12_FULL_55_11]